MKKPDASLALLGIAAFLMPVMGGYVDVSSQPAPAGLATAISGLFGTESSTLAHALLGLLVTASLCVALFKRQVIQLPQPRVAVTLGVVVVLTGLSIFLSSFRMLSLTTFAEWSLYAATLMTACTVVGRNEGPKFICAAFALGCTFLALGGMWEYVTQPDPTWRIFFHWQDPNALAGILVIGFFIAIGIGLISKGLPAILCTLSGGLIGTAILLTQSKGGLLGLFVGFLALFIFIGFYGKEKLGPHLGRLFGAVLLVLLLTPALQKLQHTAPPTSAAAVATTPAPATPAGSPALGRLLNPAVTAEQSAQFRINLWKGCIALMKNNPLGWGMGTYRFESTRPGNTSETKLAHNSFLQLAVEAGPLAGVALVALLLLCAFEMLRGSRRLPENQNLLRSSIFAAILASSVHSMFDSDLYFSGIGLSFFLLVGIGLALSGDGIVPELLKGGGKILWVGLPVFCTVLGLYAGVLQLKIEALLADFSVRTPDGMAQTVADADSLRSFCPMDYRVWYYSVPIAQTPIEAKDFAKVAVDEGPTPVTYHRLAQAELRQQEPQAAISALTNSLKIDPNNLENLLLIMKTQEIDPAAAATTARKMVAIESTTYFRTRALPEIVPTETYQAREYLAKNTNDPSEKVGLLRPAVEGMLNYANTTVPMIVKMASVGASNFGSPAEAKDRLNEAILASADLSGAYSRLNDPKDAEWARAAVAKFKSALSGLPTLG